MSNALVKSIPLTLSGSGAGMKAIPVSDEQYYAAEAGYQEVLAHPKGDSGIITTHAIFWRLKAVENVKN